MSKQGWTRERVPKSTMLKWLFRKQILKETEPQADHGWFKVWGVSPLFVNVLMQFAFT